MSHTPEETAVLNKFTKHGNQASFHYADDTCAEWPQGDAEAKKAKALFTAHPKLQAQMRRIAVHFL